MTKWEQFFTEKSKEIFETSKQVLDIGEGLRARPTSGNKFDSSRAWLQKYINKVEYKVMDPVPDYKPDIVGDIHDIPLKNESIDAIFCLAVLEHVEDPFKAVSEMHRVLKPGGKILIYVPFLYYYHAHEGYYKDYWRYTYDGLEVLARKFSQYEIQSVRGRFETVCRLTPLGRYEFFIKIFRFFDDKVLPKPSSRQVSGYNMYLVK